MISSTQGVVKVKGDLSEVMADISILVEALIDDGTLDVNDIMDAVTIGLERKGVGVIRDLDELNDFMEEMSETMEEENRKEIQKKNENPSTVDEIFKDIFKK